MPWWPWIVGAGDDTMRAGKVTSRQVGAAPAAALRSWVEQALAA